ncbi:leucine--tRNA ligase [Rurimicrobium arvi]|uniref:Leucine--tRNA ligase n=1 Tax=Rurimicrobium arvi TaxID=2049916 RepID=A0ABP8MYL3_9BACT
MEYNFRHIEAESKKKWAEGNVYRTENDFSKPKFYILDMFPYPSGAGLHVGHPLGYIASDIYARYKRMKGFNVLHPMGFDAFGLPAEQYALDTGQHPVNTTKKNIQRYKEQLDNIGFCYDWSREVVTADPKYYRWTQWIFLQLFNAYFDRTAQKAKPVKELVATFAQQGNAAHPSPEDASLRFSAAEWQSFSEKQQQDILMGYRLAFSGFGEVNWCEALGTVLANDEVVNGLSERGGHPVVKKKLRQWYLRITEYADRLLAGLDTVEFSEAMKEMQRNWIGKSTGAQIRFAVQNSDLTVEVFTTRPDTVFGVDFMVLAPEHELVAAITTPEQKAEVDAYVAYVKSRSERERMAEKKISGCFTGAYSIHPFSGKSIPVWISEYVLAGYGTGAIMAVPCGDERDHKFARHFDIPVTNIIGDQYSGEDAYTEKDFTLVNSEFINGLNPDDAAARVIDQLVQEGIGERRINYKMRDAAFSRQRYWGEPFPIRWIDGIAYPLEEGQLPLELPHVDQYGPGPDGQGPLANIESWTNEHYETNTMPGYAGSSWYFLRYMDPGNQYAFADRAATDYWNQVDIYIGGTEHAVGHLLYSRMWTKALYDLGYIGFDEPFKRLVNQGMIQGSSRFVYRIDENMFVSHGKKDAYNTTAIRIDVSMVDGVVLDTDAFKKWRSEYANAQFILEDNGQYICGVETEKMSKSKYNVVNPDDIIAQYGADTFRMYEMFLGPLDVSKPWDTKGIEGVHRFLKKLWRLYFDEQKGNIITEETPSDAELKALHKSIRKIEQDTVRFSFNTAVSQFMILVNELSDLNCHKKAILLPLAQLLAPFAPHAAEALWEQMGGSGSVVAAPFPAWEEKYTVENTKVYPVAINGKTRTELEFALDADQAAIEQVVLADEIVQKWLDNGQYKKIIFVKGKMINVVV